MHIIIGLLGIATAAYFLVMRARRGAEVATDLIDVGRDVASAARRFGFRRRFNTHVVDSIDDPNLAIGGIATAFISLADLPTQEDRARLDRALRKHLKLSASEAEELEVLGQWFVNECNGADAAVPRLTKRLVKLGGAEAFTPLMEVIQGATAAPLSTRQSEALHDIKRAFRLQ